MEEVCFKMAIGIIGAVGKSNEKITYSDHDVTLVASQGGTDNWIPYSTAGTNCHVYDLRFTDLPGANLTTSSDVTVLPRGTISESMLTNFSQINAVETGTFNDLDVVRFYSMTGKPTSDIQITLRVLNQ